ncbi:hypothetical protein [Duganella sp. Root1480D1]|uniref:hypothetical protein n=1 Tax=Duganella sp. Root1480D1 TaxID=1736471 RepID=UPI00070CD173|nr:hypothetical protein [Duganella sp. Root1480D1]KQZ26957.1 hypothetical protein ASD58_15335 [Duganella sp. Root1480D1]
MFISDDEISALLSERSISQEYPWVTNDFQEIEKFFKFLFAETRRKTQVKSLVEWQNYGSGYASFVDAWFYRESPDFSASFEPDRGESYTGLVVVLSRLSPYFVLMEGEKSWNAEGGGSSYLPNLGSVDKFRSQAVLDLASEVQAILEIHGLIRLSHEMLDKPIDPEFDVPTVLSDRPFTLFDALFHWED